jgi:hypothetical protein
VSQRDRPASDLPSFTPPPLDTPGMLLAVDARTCHHSAACPICGGVMWKTRVADLVGGGTVHAACVVRAAQW